VQSTLAITLIDDKAMRPLNKRFMGHSGTTDVLSFPMITARGRKAFQNEFLGDVVISLDQASLQADQQGISLMREVIYLLVHSVLHLLGHDHAKPTETLRMRLLEQKVWQVVMTLEK
jgi:probable rRNA maturation factor